VPKLTAPRSYFLGVEDIINVYCLDVEVVGEKRNLYERSLKIDECGLS
jgi:hypothetical protein